MRNVRRDLPRVLMRSPSLFGVLGDAPQSVFRRVEVAGRIGDDTLARSAVRIVGLMTGHEIDDFAVARAADADALLPARIIRRRRIRVDHIQLVVAVDVETARPPELLPFSDELPFAVEDLDARVAAVADEDAAARVERERMRIAEFARTGAQLAPFFDEPAVARKLH